MKHQISKFSVRRVLVAVAASALAMTSARAAVVEIAWDTSGTFQRTVEIEPGQFAEICGRVLKGQSVAWSFKSGAPMNFNIHFHEGSSVVFPARQDRIVSLEGKLEVAKDRDYCWMWENKSKARDTLIVVLRRQ